MPHFFINSNQIQENKIILSEDENFVHIKSSLRAKVGELFLFIDENYIQYEAIVQNIDKKNMIFEISKSYKSKRFIPHNVYLAQAVLKNEAQNYLIQKVSELGVKGIYPLITDNCVIKPQVAQQKINHWQKISQEASKQCERPDVATIFPLCNFDFLINNKEFEHIFIFAERNSTTQLKEITKKEKINSEDKILLVTGPEGGFSANEFEKMDKYSMKKLTLGNLILRADTAAISAVATTLYELGY